MKYELFFSKSSVVIKVIMPNTNIIYQHMGFDNFLEDQYFEDEDSNFMYFVDETRLGKTKMIQAFLEDSEEEVISFADFNTDIILFDESEFKKFELEENVNL